MPLLTGLSLIVGMGPVGMAGVGGAAEGEAMRDLGSTAVLPMLVPVRWAVKGEIGGLFAVSTATWSWNYIRQEVWAVWVKACSFNCVGRKGGQREYHTTCSL